jgi:hypothetical protein
VVTAGGGAGGRVAGAGGRVAGAGGRAAGAGGTVSLGSDIVLFATEKEAVRG